MKVTGKAGWERTTPIEEHPELTCEIKRLSLVEKMELTERLTEDSGNISVRFGGKQGRDIFTEHVRKISGLEYDGKELSHSDILSDNMPADDGVMDFLIQCVGRFWDMNFITNEERSDLSTPSDTNGVEDGDPTEALPE